MKKEIENKIENNKKLNNNEIKTIYNVEKRKIKASHKFITGLSVISIIGFIGIVSKTIFEYDLINYTEASLMFIIGLALIIETKLEKIKSIRHGVNSSNFTALITIIIGAIAILAGILSFPSVIRIDAPGFNATKGIISIIAIIMIVVQTWIIEQ